MKTTLIACLFIVIGPIGLFAQPPEAEGNAHAPGGNCVRLDGTGPDGTTNGTTTYVAGLSYDELRATPAIDPTRDEVPTSPMQAVRIAADYLSKNHPRVLREWELSTVQLTKYEFPDGQVRWYYAIQYLTPVRDVPKYRPGLLYIVVTSAGKLGFFRPKPGAK